MYPQQHTLFLLAVGVLALGTFAALRFLLEAFLARHERHWPLAEFALGVFLFAQTAVPIAISSYGARLVLDHLFLYLGTSFLLSFVGFLFIYDGARTLIGLSSHRKFLGAWAALVGLFYIGYFTVGGGMPTKAIWNLPTILLAFLPIHMLLLFTFVKWGWRTSPLLRSGAGAMAFASLLLSVRDIIYAGQLMQYPGFFWFVVYFSARPLLLLQLAGIFFFLLGGSMVHWHYTRRGGRGVMH